VFVTALDYFLWHEEEDARVVVTTSPVELVSSLDAHFPRELCREFDLHLGADPKGAMQRGHS
jgi:hypothetical protein